MSIANDPYFAYLSAIAGQVAGQLIKPLADLVIGYIDDSSSAIERCYSCSWSSGHTRRWQLNKVEMTDLPGIAIRFALHSYRGLRRWSCVWIEFASARELIDLMRGEKLVNKIMSQLLPNESQLLCRPTVEAIVAEIDQLVASKLIACMPQ